MIEIFKEDWKHYTKKEWSKKCWLQVIKSKTLKYVLAGRYSANGGIFSPLWWGIQRYLGTKMGCEIEWKNIKSGVMLSHPYGITVNPSAKLGKNCCLFKGCTIGSIRSGKNAGVPSIGDRVTICCNAMVCGNIKIGNDVLIAAGAYVNFDVPDNSIVIGNPGVVHKKENPSGDYL